MKISPKGGKQHIGAMFANGEFDLIVFLSYLAYSTASRARCIEKNTMIIQEKKENGLKIN